MCLCVCVCVSECASLAIEAPDHYAVRALSDKVRMFE